LRGAGLTQVYLYQAAPKIESGELEIVLQDFESPAVPVCLAIPKGQNSPQKVKAFINFAKPLLEQSLKALHQAEPAG
jgi:DNA-binding transcriptional LysR family regulator